MNGKQFYVYILTNERHTVLYTGVTSNLGKRVYEHKQKVVRGFTQKYNCEVLVYYEVADSVVVAMEREQQIKAGSRKKKEALVESINPTWKDLGEELG